MRPAISVVERLREELPDLEIQLIVDDHLHGQNHKVSNLANMSGATFTVYMLGMGRDPNSTTTPKAFAGPATPRHDDLHHPAAAAG